MNLEPLHCRALAKRAAVAAPSIPGFECDAQRAALHFLLYGGRL